MDIGKRVLMEYYFRPDSFFQVSPANCSGDPHRSSCQLLESEVWKQNIMENEVADTSIKKLVDDG